MRWLTELHSFAAISRDPDSRYDNFHFDTQAARQLSEEIERTEAVMERDDIRLEAALIDLGRNRQFQRARKGSGKVYKAGVPREDVARAREQLQSELARFEADANADLAALLCRELRACASRYEAEKAKAGALDFLDLLLKTRNLVKDDHGVRRSFQDRFKRLFVDEFQDTDPLQAEILMLLASDDPSVTDWHEAHPSPGKLFLVGDPKQSIYRFRRADVGTYRDVYSRLESAQARRVTLSASFRARPNIQTRDQCGVRTCDGRSARIPENPGSWYVPRTSPPGGAGPAVGRRPACAGTLWLAANLEHRDRSVAARCGGGVRRLAHQRERLESVGSGRRRWRMQPWRGASSLANRSIWFRIQARHICLLFRRFASYGQDMTRPYVRALEARGIPHLLVGGRSFHNRAEIETLRAALNAIEWPDDELSVFAALRGSLFAIGDEELLEYRHRVGSFHPFRTPTMRRWTIGQTIADR